MSYDLYQPWDQHPHAGGDYTLALCPGIGNSSESVYIRYAAAGAVDSH